MEQEDPGGDHAGFVDALAKDFQKLALDPGDRALLDYAVKLTRTPGAISADDVEVLRDSGFDDVAIHDLAAVTAYFAFVNRIADGLGVELEDRWEGGPAGGLD